MCLILFGALSLVLAAVAVDTAGTRCVSGAAAARINDAAFVDLSMCSCAAPTELLMLYCVRTLLLWHFLAWVLDWLGDSH